MTDNIYKDSPELNIRFTRDKRRKLEAALDKYSFTIEEVFKRLADIIIEEGKVPFQVRKGRAKEFTKRNPRQSTPQNRGRSGQRGQKNYPPRDQRGRGRRNQGNQDVDTLADVHIEHLDGIDEHM